VLNISLQRCVGDVKVSVRIFLVTCLGTS